jgi:hypothetical protein
MLLVTLPRRPLAYHSQTGTVVDPNQSANDLTALVAVHPAFRCALPGMSLAKVASRYAVRYSTLMEPRGIYRERNGWDDQHSARVRYDEHQELDMSESRYRERGYNPPFDELPWKDETENDV